MVGGGGGGSANAAAAQNLADANRSLPSSALFLRRGDWIRLAIAAIPLVTLTIIALIVT